LRERLLDDLGAPAATAIGAETIGCSMPNVRVSRVEITRPISSRSPRHKGNDACDRL
jgi:hypothetical protein